MRQPPIARHNDPMTDEEFERAARAEGLHLAKLGEPAPSPLVVLGWLRWALDLGFRRAAELGIVQTDPGEDLRNRAIEIVEACVSWQEDDGSCHFCDYHGVLTPHAKDCPLVEQGFIERTGTRT